MEAGNSRNDDRALVNKESFATIQKKSDQNINSNLLSLPDSTVIYWVVLAWEKYGNVTYTDQWSFDIRSQSPVGIIVGLITEVDGTTPIDSVLVRAIQSGTEISQDTTDINGQYALANLSPGLYDIEASKNMYQPQTREQLEVTAGRTDTVNFQMTLATPSCPYTIGDINSNGQTNGIDVTYGVGFFKGGNAPPVSCPMCPEPNPFYAAGDVNGNCVFNGIDITYFVGYLKGGPALMSCPDCPPASLMIPSVPAIEPISPPRLQFKNISNTAK
jgi:hypothetical protein